MFRWTSYNGLILTTSVAVACLVEGRQDGLDSQVFGAAVSGMTDVTLQEAHFDPHPVRIRDDAYYPEPSDYYTDAAAEAAARLNVLEKLGLITVRAFPLLPDCGPLMADPENKVTHGCPEHRLDVAFDRIRRSEKPDQWVIRKMDISYSKAGRSATISDLTIARRGEKYVLEGERVLVHIE